MVCPDIYLHTLGVTIRDQPPRFVVTSCCKATRAREGAEGDEDTPTVAAGDLAAKRLVCFFFSNPNLQNCQDQKKISH